MALGAVERRGDVISVRRAKYAIAFSAKNGSILSLTESGREGPILRSGVEGLWQARFQDGTTVDAAQFAADSTSRAFKCEADAGTDVVRMTFRGPEVAVEVTVKPGAGGVDFTADVTPAEKVVLDFALPARLRFAPQSVERFVFPIGGNNSVGVAFNAAFFGPQDEPVGWRSRTTGPEGHIAVYGGPLDQREYEDPPTTLQVTAQGSEWLGDALVKRVQGASAVVNRPPTREQADIALVDSPNGPYFSACRLGGKGHIWRIGGTVGMLKERLGEGDVVDMVIAVVDRLAASRSGGRRKLGILALKYGWHSAAEEWIRRVRGCRAAMAEGAEVVELSTPRQMLAAMEGTDFLSILNPCGEFIPVPDDGGIEAVATAIRQYVRAGGNWFEVSGYPFYYELRAYRYLSIQRNYPEAFADFLHLDARTGSASLYGVQPQKWAPWEGAKNKAAIFVPARLGCGADGDGGYCLRSFGTYVKPRQTWRSPVVRLGVGQPAVQAIQAYCKANRIERKLKDKMSPELLEKFKKSVVLSYHGSCRNKLASLESLPVPTLLFFTDYLKGGFDKEYPDHLPPRADFGTPEEFRAFIDKAHKLGHIVMPYTNPTWWCDHPRGPTFVREGEEPLLKKLDGKLSYESYGTAKNDGYTVCHWHPAVRQANRKTVRQFTQQYPVSVLFQDQNGARGWHYDTNPASPTPYAYFDGLISQAAEDYTKGTPLSTEGGCDRLVNYESQFSGLSFDLVPLAYKHRWIRLLKSHYPPKTWEVFPVALYIAHDKTAMIHHFILSVTGRKQLAWTLGIGFSLNYGGSSNSEWFKWLDRVQKSVCARYVGEPLRSFKHDRGHASTPDDDGALRATYGQVKMITNVGPRRRAEAGRDLAPYGFYITGPGLVAADLNSLAGVEFGDRGLAFVAEATGRKADIWVYAPPEQLACVELPADVSGDVAVAFDNAPAARKTVADGILRVRLPARPGHKRLQPPASLAGTAPCDWPGQKPCIGLLNMPGIHPVWTRIAVADWLKALENSRLAKGLGVPVRSIATVPELVAALKAGPKRWLAIINPYGEALPVTAPDKWREMIDGIRGYVSNGGCWWETGGYSMHSAYSPNGAEWRREPVGMAGMAFLGVPVGPGEVDEPAQPLCVSPEAREWLGEKLSARVDRSASMVNRGLPRGPSDPGHFTLVAGDDVDFIGGYRLDGWGWFWRIGGFRPNADVALPVAVAATAYIYTHRPVPVTAAGPPRLWHATVTAAGGN